MITLLGWLLDGIELMGLYVAYGGELVVNALFAAIGAAATAAFALLPSMSSAPVIGSPTWLGWLNWFFPVGDLVAGLTACIVLWTGYLAVRYILRLVRAL